MLLTIVSLLVLAIISFAVLEYRTFKTPKIKVAANASTAEKLDALDQWFDALEKQGKFNGSFLFARNGTPVVQRNIGNTDASGQRRISERTSFNLASVTKHFTAFAILMLAYENKISLDDPLTNHIPELSRYKQVSIRQLLAHTSGIPEYAFLKPKALEGREVIDMGFLISWLTQETRKADFEPGTKYAYTNTNYVLLAEIIARVSGKSFAQFMEERIFTPLEMADTAVVNKVVNLNTLEDRAYGFRPKYLYFGKPVEHDLNHLDGVAGDGSIYASANDLLKWNAALREGRLLPTAYSDQLFQPITLENGEVIEDKIWGDRYNFGFGVTWKNGDPSGIYAYGGWQGFINFMAWDVVGQDTLVVLSNSQFGLGTFSVSEKFEKWARDFR